MKLVRIVPLSFLLLLGAAGCKKSTKTDGEKAIEEMEAAATEFCKCAKGDLKCLDAADKKTDGLEERMEKQWGEESKVPADMKKRYDDAVAKTMKCAAEGHDEKAPDGPPPTGDAAAEATKTLDEMAALKDEICKCTDMACAEPHGAKLNAAEEKLMTLFPDKASVPAELMTRGEQIENQLKDCMAKLGGEAAPPAGNADVDKVIADLTAIKDEVCKCADKACAEGAFSKGEALEESLMKALGGKEPTPEQAAKLDEIEKGAEECAGKFQ